MPTIGVFNDLLNLHQRGAYLFKRTELRVDPIVTLAPRLSAGVNYRIKHLCIFWSL